MNACTIVAKNYLAHARVLARSFHEHHPDGRFTVLVLDEAAGAVDLDREPFDVLTPFDIGLEEFLVLAGTYDVLELSTAVKPWLLRTLLAGHDHVVYLDPDIQVHAPLDDIAALAREHGMVLTPHNVAPMPRDGKKPSETDILIAGAYNLGFLGVGDGEATHAFLDWWAERLRTDCIVDPDRGYFVDQRWIDLVPGLVPSFHLLRDPGYNVAYWNLWTREVEQDADGRWLVNGSPLRFLHLSGYDPRRPERLSKHQDRIDLAERPALRTLCDGYGAALLEEGFEQVIGLPYTYAATPGGLLLDQPSRRLYSEGIKAGALGLPLFAAEGEAAFVAYARQPAEGDAEYGITRYTAALHGIRADLKAAFPSFTGEAGALLARWAVEDGPVQHPGTAALMVPAGADRDVAAAAVDGSPAPEPGPRTPPELDPAVPFGVNLVGYLSAELGVGEVARQVVGALDNAGVPLLPIRQVATASRQGQPFTAVSELTNPFAVNLLCVNADQTPSVAAQAGPGFFDGRYTVGWWWWEVQDFPDVWLGAFDHLDELWVGSRFVADALAPVSPVPVLRMPLPVSAPVNVDADRGKLGLPEDAFLYLFAFDFNSIVDRKNPQGLVEAYVRAHPAPEPGVGLVLKAINGERHPEKLAALREAIGDRPDVVLLDRYLSAAEKDGLIAACDCYVSLHRSEGFGIGMAEAALLGKPVIATGYGGNVDFLGPPGGLLVRHELVPIGPGNEPYPADGVWAAPDLDHAAELLVQVREDRAGTAAVVDATRRYLLDHHSHAAAGELMARRLLHVAGDRPRPDELLEGQLQAAREATLRGPARWPHDPRSPKRLVRAAAIRAGRPLLTHEQETSRALLAAVEAEVRGVRAELALAEARALARDRARQAADAAQVRHLTGLQAFADRADAGLREVQRLSAAASATPYMSEDALQVRDGVLRFEGAAEGGYRAFEDLFRGSEAMIRARQRRYLDVLRGAGPVFDAGCGRGELLDLLAEEGIDATGADLDEELVRVCHEKGHAGVQHGDAVALLEAAEPGSLGAVTSMQVVEHLPEAVLLRFVAAAAKALRPGGVLVMETVNPHSPAALKAFWVDPSHQHPLFPEVLLQLARAAGFGRGEAFCPNGAGDWDSDRLTQGEYAVVATR